MSTAHPRSTGISVVLTAVSISVQEKSQTLCPFLQRSHHLIPTGNKQGLAIYHITINLKSTPNTLLISQPQQKTNQFLKWGFYQDQWQVCEV